MAGCFTGLFLQLCAGIVLPTEGITAFLGCLRCWLVGYTLFMVVLDIIYAQLERPPVSCLIALIGYTRGAERYSNPAADLSGKSKH